MRNRYLAILLAAVVAMCALSLAACIGGESASAKESAQDGAGATELSESDKAAEKAEPAKATDKAEADESEESTGSADSTKAADPSEKFIGSWKIAGGIYQGVNFAGDLSSASGSEIDVSITVNKDKTGSLSNNGEEKAITWESVDDDNITIINPNASEPDESRSGVPGLIQSLDAPDEDGTCTLKVNYKDGMLIIEKATKDPEGSVYFTKDGTLPGAPIIQASALKPITSKDSVIGTWSISAVDMRGGIFYGDSDEILRQMGNGQEGAAAEFKEDGTATIMGDSAQWEATDEGVFVLDGDLRIPVESLDGDLAIDFSEAYSEEFIVLLSKRG